MRGRRDRGRRLRTKKKNDDDDDAAALKNQNEFIAYRIIYYVFLSQNKKYEGGSSDIFKVCVGAGVYDGMHSLFIFFIISKKYQPSLPSFACVFCIRVFIAILMQDYAAFDSRTA